MFACLRKRNGLRLGDGKDGGRRVEPSHVTGNRSSSLLSPLTNRWVSNVLLVEMNEVVMLPWGWVLIVHDLLQGGGAENFRTTLVLPDTSTEHRQTSSFTIMHA